MSGYNSGGKEPKNGGYGGSDKSKTGSAGGQRDTTTLSRPNALQSATNRAVPTSRDAPPETPGGRSASTGGGAVLGPLGGGTTTQEEYTPGAVGSFPDANAAAVADMLTNAVPFGGAVNTAYKGAKALGGSDPLSASNMGPLGDMLGGDPGPQRGYQPDKYRGNASLTGLGGDGGAVNDQGGNIAGRSYGAGTAALTGDLPDEGGDMGGGGTDEFSDVVLRDRRKPRLGAGTQMVLGQ